MIIWIVQRFEPKGRRFGNFHYYEKEEEEKKQEKQNKNKTTRRLAQHIHTNHLKVRVLNITRN